MITLTIKLSHLAPNQTIEEATIEETASTTESAVESVPASASHSSSSVYEFDKILAHEGPLSWKSQNYHGSAYNVKVLWSDKTITWEPLSRIAEDAPEIVSQYGQENNLLHKHGWKRLKKAL
jgi:hypothetical protein